MQRICFFAFDTSGSRSTTHCNHVANPINPFNLLHPANSCVKPSEAPSFPRGRAAADYSDRMNGFIGLD